MKNLGTFKMESRPYGDGYTNMVGLKCGWCDHEGWHPARDGGWAIRIFRNQGWKVGAKPHQHRCPTCFGKARLGRRKADNPAIPPEIGKAIKARLALDHTKEVLMATTAQKLAQEGPPATADPMPPAEPPRPATADPGPPAPQVMRRPVRGQMSVPGVTMFTRREHAARSGVNQTGSVDGLGFYTMPLGDGWTWKRVADTTPEERAGWMVGRKIGPRPIPRKDGSHVVLQAPRKEAPMTSTVTPIRKDPMPTQEPLPSTEIHAAPPPKLDRASRTMIHDELTHCYDTADQRYANADSDKVVAERLNVPRAWVKEVREQMFGDHDRNQAAAAQIVKLDKAIELAKQATTRLMEMASEAETLEQSLSAARKLLEA